MVDVTYQLSELLGLAFGVKSPVFLPAPITIGGRPSIEFKPGEDKITQAAVNYSNIELPPLESAERLSWMGTPIVFPFTFKGGTYKVFNSTNDIVDYRIGDFELPAATMVDFTREKNNPVTQMPGNVGTVKEFYSFADWVVRIRGLCLDDPSRKTAPTAKEQKQELLKWNDICSAVSVVGELFFEKNINALSLGPVRFGTLEGKPNVFPFEIDCLSDKRFELVL
jgi:hypothetical protein